MSFGVRHLNTLHIQQNWNENPSNLKGPVVKKSLQVFLVYLFIFLSYKAVIQRKGRSMSASSGRQFFNSYSCIDTAQKQNIMKQLRAAASTCGWKSTNSCLARPHENVSSSTAFVARLGSLSCFHLLPITQRRYGAKLSSRKGSRQQ